jgi:hypothetical protein
MKKVVIIVVAIVGVVYLQKQWGQRFDESQKAKPAPPPPAASVAKAPPPAPPPKPKKPLEHLRLPYPPTREQLAALVPNYDALENQIRTDATRMGINFTEPQLYEAMGQGWNALTGTGGTAQDRYRWEMGMFDTSASRRDYDGVKYPEERTNSFQVLQNGARVYSKTLPLHNDGITECWEKIEVSRGTENHGTFMTIGGTKMIWIKRTWDDKNMKWVRRTDAEHQQFVDGYDRKLTTELIPAAYSNAAKAPDLKYAKEISGVVFAYRPAFEVRYLTLFQKDFRTIPWEQE